MAVNRIVKKISVHLLSLTFFLGVAHTALAETLFKINTSIKPPMSTQEQTGFFDVLVKELFTRLNIPAEIVRLPAERALVRVNQGVSDGELPRVAGLAKKYPNIIQVPEKLIDSCFVAFSQPEKIAPISFDTIKSKRVGIIIGWKIYEKNTADFSNLYKVALPTQLFSMLDLDRLDVALFERYNGQYILQPQKFKNIHECTPPLGVKPGYMYVHKKHSELIPKIVQTLKAIKSDGTYQQIFTKTLGVYFYDRRPKKQW